MGYNYCTPYMIIYISQLLNKIRILLISVSIDNNYLLYCSTYMKRVYLCKYFNVIVKL